ncbi:MAG: hypothetical protein QOE60_2109 [Thermoleophilaceae bacterium]|nr:hypothetical protein [Thermoleophilaceae bacterium]
MAGACSLAVAPVASAHAEKPRSAAAFRDSVGVVTHIAYFDTAYGNWPRVVSRLDELGVRHLRDGLYGNPAPAWHDWNERYFQAVDLAAAHGMRFDFIVGRPGNPAGTLDQLLNVAAGRLRHATEALEEPNEVDHFFGTRGWASRLTRYSRDLYRKVKSNPALRTLPVIGPSFGTIQGASRVGDQRAHLDVGNIHPYTYGLSPDPRHVRAEMARGSAVSGRKPVWATEAGFHNAMRGPAEQQPGVSEQAAAIYLTRTFLQHFQSGVRRTYAYELLDEHPDRRGRDPEQHFGLLRRDFSPKPAYRALKNLLTLVGPAGRHPRLRPLRLHVSGPADLHRLVLRKADGTYLVALWRTASVWDIERKRPLHVAPRRVWVAIPGAKRLAAADPVRSPRLIRAPLRHGRIGLLMAGRPVLLEVTPQR